MKYSVGCSASLLSQLSTINIHADNLFESRNVNGLLESQTDEALRALISPVNKEWFVVYPYIKNVNPGCVLTSIKVENCPRTPLVHIPLDQHSHLPYSPLESRIDG